MSDITNNDITHHPDFMEEMKKLTDAIKLKIANEDIQSFIERMRYKNWHMLIDAISKNKNNDIDTFQFVMEINFPTHIRDRYNNEYIAEIFDHLEDEVKTHFSNISLFIKYKDRQMTHTILVVMR